MSLISKQFFIEEILPHELIKDDYGIKQTLFEIENFYDSIDLNQVFLTNKNKICDIYVKYYSFLVFGC